MDFSWNDEQKELREAARTFAERELQPTLGDREAAQTFSRDIWKKCAEFGTQGAALDAEFGGSELDTLTTIAMFEGLGIGAADNGLLFALGAQMWSVQHPISLYGTDAQKQKYLPGMCKGEIVGAHGMSEPDSGSDAFSLKTRAIERDGGYILNGAKTLVTSAPDADMALVFAATDPDKGKWGITGFLVDSEYSGFSRGNNMHKMGLRTSSIGELVFDDCFVPAQNVLGEPGSGANIFNAAMAMERACILAGHIGAMQRQLEKSVRYARERRQFDQSIGKFQSVSNRVADMKVRLDASRMLLYQVAWLQDQGKNNALEAAIAKLFISEAFVTSSLDAIRLHGGYGYLSESEVERDLRDAVGGTLYSGTSDIQRNLIAGLLGV